MTARPWPRRAAPQGRQDAPGRSGAAPGRGGIASAIASAGAAQPSGRQDRAEPRGRDNGNSEEREWEGP